MIIYGIEQTTDSRYPETTIVRFTNRKRALEWKAGGGGFAWEGGARGDIPVQQQNWHHRLRDLYEMPTGWRKPTIKEQRAYCEKWRGSSRRVTMQDEIANAIHREGERIEVPAPQSPVKEQ